VPELQFQVEDVVATPNSATPQLTFKLRIANSVPGESIQSLALRCQIQIEPVRRRYTANEQSKLLELFGEPERWSHTLRSMPWANLSVNVSGFTEGTVVDLIVPCTFDFNVALTKYAYGLDDGDLPTLLLFSGTAFYAGRSSLQIAQIPWDREASYRIPLRTWKEMMDSFYPNSAWLCLRREAFNRLFEYKERQGIATFEEVIERMLGTAAEAKA
jgi:hypothetical protein